MTDPAATRLICPLTAPTVEQMRSDMLCAAESGADTIEVRLDLLDSIPDDAQLHVLLTDSPVDVIATARASREGGKFPQCDEAARLDLLKRAAKFDSVAFVDVELDVPREDWPAAPEKIILSHHNFVRVPENLHEVIAQMEASEAAVNKIAFAAAGPEDALLAADIICSCKKPTLALAMGEAGVVSRILARKFGAFGTFASLQSGCESAPGQPTLDEMRNLYRWNSQDESTQVFGVIGCPVGHSMSPMIHNTAFDKVGFNGVYVPLLIQPGHENFARFMQGIVERPHLNFRGFSVTIPHKHNALEFVTPENCDELPRTIGAVNTITVDSAGKFRGDNTDYAGAIDALCDKMKIAREDLASRRVALLGAGGASRALAAALSFYGAEVTIYNRTLLRAETLAAEFGCVAKPLNDAVATDAEILINCTAIGMHPNVDDAPVCELSDSLEVVFDTVYNPLETKLLAMAAAKKCLTVSGLDMFVNQAAGQFELWTEIPAPLDVMRKVVLEQLQRK
ncbi:MAG: shikimate dehydrogenase [Phycisphaerae bacterium]|nr:shikimate dehydrogenase [Phycisphaerae bacterium]